MFNDDRHTVGETRNQIQLTAQSLDVAAQRRKQDVAPAFDPRNRILADTQASSQVLLRTLYSFT